MRGSERGVGRGRSLFAFKYFHFQRTRKSCSWLEVNALMWVFLWGEGKEYLWINAEVTLSLFKKINKSCTAAVIHKMLQHVGINEKVGALGRGPGGGGGVAVGMK